MILYSVIYVLNSPRVYELGLPWPATMLNETIIIIDNV